MQTGFICREKEEGGEKQKKVRRMKGEIETDIQAKTLSSTLWLLCPRTPAARPAGGLCTSPWCGHGVDEKPLSWTTKNPIISP
jgi:hypothetical protein